LEIKILKISCIKLNTSSTSSHKLEFTFAETKIMKEFITIKILVLMLCVGRLMRCKYFCVKEFKRLLILNGILLEEIIIFLVS